MAPGDRTKKETDFLVDCLKGLDPLLVKLLPDEGLNYLSRQLRIEHMVERTLLLTSGEAEVKRFRFRVRVRVSLQSHFNFREIGWQLILFLLAG